MRKLRPYQTQAAEFVLRNKRCILAVPMGLGKTVSSLTGLDMAGLVEHVTPALVVAPLRVAQSTWTAEVQEWAHLRHLRVSVVTGTKDQRLRALRTPADLYCTNYESIEWLVKELGERWPFKTVIADECTKLKGFRSKQGTKRARLLQKAAAKSSRFIGLTGTPAPNGLRDLWGQMYFVDQGKRLGATYGAYTDRWFRRVQVGNLPMAVRYDAMPHAQAEIHELVRDVMLSFKASDHLDLTEAVVTDINVRLPKDAKRVYRELETEMFAALDDGKPIEAANGAAKTMRCLQLANGAIYTDDDRKQWSAVHDGKLEALESVIEEANGAPVLVAYNFRHDAERIRAKIKGSRMLDKSPKTIDEWNAGQIPVLLAHPASAGHGLNLAKGGNILVFFGLNWNLEEHLQIIERIGPTRQAQLGSGKATFIYRIITKGTVDSLVLQRLTTKREVQDILMEALKARKS